MTPRSVPIGHLNVFLLNIKDFPKSVDLQLEASELCVSFFVYQGSGPAVGVIATHIDDLLGCCEKEVFDGPLWPRGRSKGYLRADWDRYSSEGGRVGGTYATGIYGLALPNCHFLWNSRRFCYGRIVLDP